MCTASKALQRITSPHIVQSLRGFERFWHGGPWKGLPHLVFKVRLRGSHRQNQFSITIPLSAEDTKPLKSYTPIISASARIGLTEKILQTHDWPEIHPFKVGSSIKHLPIRADYELRFHYAKKIVLSRTCSPPMRSTFA